MGLVLTTLLVWRMQVQEARKLTWERQCAQQGALLAGERPARSGPSAADDLSRSQYMRVCQPVLEALAEFGTWAVPIVGCGLAAFLGATLAMQPEEDAASGDAAP